MTHQYLQSLRDNLAAALSELQNRPEPALQDCYIALGTAYRALQEHLGEAEPTEGDRLLDELYAVLYSI